MIVDQAVGEALKCFRIYARAQARVGPGLVTPLVIAIQVETTIIVLTAWQHTGKSHHVYLIIHKALSAL